MNDTKQVHLYDKLTRVLINTFDTVQEAQDYIAAQERMGLPGGYIIEDTKNSNI